MILGLEHVEDVRAIGLGGADDEGACGVGAAVDGEGRRRLIDVDAMAFALAMERAGDMMKAKQAHPAYSSFLKYYGTELNKRRHELVMSSLGSDGLEWESERSQEGDAPRAWLRTKANSIEGGTSEVMLNVVAKRILEMPGA